MILLIRSDPSGARDEQLATRDLKLPNPAKKKLSYGTYTILQLGLVTQTKLGTLNMEIRSSYQQETMKRNCAPESGTSSGLRDVRLEDAVQHLDRDILLLITTVARCHPKGRRRVSFGRAAAFAGKLWNDFHLGATVALGVVSHDDSERRDVFRLRRRGRFRCNGVARRGCARKRSRWLLWKCLVRPWRSQNPLALLRFLRGRFRCNCLARRGSARVWIVVAVADAEVIFGEELLFQRLLTNEVLQSPELGPQLPKLHQISLFHMNFDFTLDFSTFGLCPPPPCIFK